MRRRTARRSCGLLLEAPASDRGARPPRRPVLEGTARRAAARQFEGPRSSGDRPPGTTTGLGCRASRQSPRRARRTASRVRREGFVALAPRAHPSSSARASGSRSTRSRGRRRGAKRFEQDRRGRGRPGCSPDRPTGLVRAPRRREQPRLTLPSSGGSRRKRRQVVAVHTRSRAARREGADEAVRQRSSTACTGTI